MWRSVVARTQTRTALPTNCAEPATKFTGCRPITRSYATRFDDHIEAVIVGANDDRIIEAVMDEISGIVRRPPGPKRV